MMTEARSSSLPGQRLFQTISLQRRRKFITGRKIFPHFYLICFVYQCARVSTKFDRVAWQIPFQKAISSAISWMVRINIDFISGNILRTVALPLKSINTALHTF